MVKEILKFVLKRKMKEIRKNNKSELSEFLRYVRGEMTKREEHAFQRKLQKDPFADEALEGFEEIDPGIAENDILKLRKQVKRRTSGKQRTFWLRIAASVAILMIISSLLIIINKKKPSEQIAYTPVPHPKEEVNIRPEPKAAPEKPVSIESPVTITEKSNQIQLETERPEEQPVGEAKAKEEIISDENKDTIAVPKAVEAAEPEKLVEQGRAMAAKSALADEVKAAYLEQNDSTSGYIPAQPATGKADFDRYIYENIRKPDTTASGQGGLVVLNFVVNSEGKIDSIRVIRSPGKIFSDEAIRLIKEGPAWKPAEKNGQTITDEVRIRIVFQ
jgi:TonB family protein